MNNLTALMSSFVKAYHNENSNVKIFEDDYAKKLIENEYDKIYNELEKGIAFFNPLYKEDNPVEWIVNMQLGPSVFARQAINEKYLKNSIIEGATQYLLLGSGYDTSGYKVKIKCFELDKEETIIDKKKRVKKANIDDSRISYVPCDFNNDWHVLNGYNNEEKSFCSILGVSYYLSKDSFSKTICALSKMISSESYIFFDYPNKKITDNEKTNQKLAEKANEQMKSTYSLEEIEEVAKKNDFIIYNHYNNEEVDKEFFFKYNQKNESKIKAPEGVSYCILKKK